MQDTDRKGASGAQTDDTTGTGKSGKPPTGVQTPLPPDLVLDALEQATAVVTSAKPATVSARIEGDLENFIKGLLPKPLSPIPENVCTNPKPKIAPFCFALKLARQQANLTHEGSVEAQATGLRGALGAWQMALTTYEAAIATAEATLRQTVTAAVDTYNSLINDDSHSREFNLYFTMRETVAGAIQTFESSAAVARATLAGDAGTLLVDYEVYIDGINAAHTQFMLDQAIANQVFWSNVEGALDVTS